MATFSLGNSAVAPGAPGVYINERPGALGTPAISTFSTTYMLVEVEDKVSSTIFPFNKPVAITSINDYKALLGGKLPQERIAALSYNCVQEFFANAQVGDLRVVRVGTPAQITEIELLPSGNKVNTSGTPSALVAGETVYIQMVINGIKLVPGSGASGFDADGNYLGVPVVIPVNYIAGDVINNRKIAEAMAKAVADAMETNPSVASSIYVRDFGMLNEKDPIKYATSQNSYVTISSKIFGGNVSLATQVSPVGAANVLMQNGYDIENIVGQENLEKVPQDYIQCIATAFDGQQDQGYLITPTAYAQFDQIGRAAIGAAAANHCADNAYKWMAIADPGPFLVTDVNKYSSFTPHKAAEDLVTNEQYLIDNAIYKWVGATVRHPRLTYQALTFGTSPKAAVTQSTNTVPAGTKVGILDAGKYTTSIYDGALGRLQLYNDNYWPSDLNIQKVVVSNAEDATNPFNKYNGKTVYLVAPAFDTAEYGSYSFNYVYFAETPADAGAVLNAVQLAGGSSKMTTLPTGAVKFPASTDTCVVDYEVSVWDFPVEINGQSSDLVENVTDQQVGVNTLHLPATLQNATANYRLNFQSRTCLNPQVSITSAVQTGYAGAAMFTVRQHGLVDGQKVFFTQAIRAGGADVFKATTKNVTFSYFVKALSNDTFVLAASITALAASSYVPMPSAPFAAAPTVIYTAMRGGSETAIDLIELSSIPFLRGRKYGFASGTIDNIASLADKVPALDPTAPGVSVWLNNSAQILGKAQTSPWGETTNAGWLPKLELVDPGDETSVVGNFYCVPTAAQSYTSEAYLVPALDAILGGSFSPSGAAPTGPVASIGSIVGGSGGADGTYTNVALTGGTGTGATADIEVVGGEVTVVTLKSGGSGYQLADTLGAASADIGNTTGFSAVVTSITPAQATGNVSNVTPYAQAAGLADNDPADKLQSLRNLLVGVYFNVTSDGFAPDGKTAVVKNDRLALVSDGVTVSWAVAKPDAIGDDENLQAVGLPLYGAPVEIAFLPEETPQPSLWRFDAITSTNIIDDALRGVGFNGVPQAVFVEAGVDNVTRLLEDSQRYENAFGFIAFYGPYIQNAVGQWIPPSPYVTGIALRRYRAEGYQFPPAGVKYVLADAIGAQIAVNSAQQNLLNPKGCNILRSLPGYPQTSVYVWGGRTRINEADAQQRLYQFVNTRVILNVVYGSLRNAFDNQIFNVIDGFGVVYNQIINVGNSVLNELYVKGALFGARPSEAFQVICDERINSGLSLESGLVNAKVFVTPVPTLERIQIDLIRVAIGNMQKELDIQGLGQTNSI
jgi:hypothetical protein